MMSCKTSGAASRHYFHRVWKAVRCVHLVYWTKTNNYIWTHIVYNVHFHTVTWLYLFSCPFFPTSFHKMCVVKTGTESIFTEKRWCFKPEVIIFRRSGQDWDWIRVKRRYPSSRSGVIGGAHCSLVIARWWGIEASSWWRHDASLSSQAETDGKNSALSHVAVHRFIIQLEEMDQKKTFSFGKVMSVPSVFFHAWGKSIK